MKTLIITNLGGPRNSSEILPFLTDLFTDPYLFDLPLPIFIQSKIGKMIAKRRTPKVEHAYSSMNYGGGSPLYDETLKQGTALERELTHLTNEPWQVVTKMACGFPNLRELNFEKLKIGEESFILPLYPQFSRSTTLSTVKIFQDRLGYCPVSKSERCKEDRCIANCQLTENSIKGWINPFYEHPEFIDATTSLIVDFFEKKLQSEQFINLDEAPDADWKEIPILFSAHGIPLRLVKKGDGYPNQIEKTKELITKQLRNHGYKATTYLSYQSKVGPARWTEPSTLNALAKLGKSGIKKIAIYPISFVSDHLETLEEIGGQLREHAMENGIKEYYRIPALGIYPKFINFLAKLVAENSML